MSKPVGMGREPTFVMMTTITMSMVRMMKKRRLKLVQLLSTN